MRIKCVVFSVFYDLITMDKHSIFGTTRHDGLVVFLFCLIEMIHLGNKKVLNNIKKSVKKHLQIQLHMVN